MVANMFECLLFNVVAILYLVQFADGPSPSGGGFLLFRNWVSITVAALNRR